MPLKSIDESLIGMGSYLSAEMPSAYSTGQTDWAGGNKGVHIFPKDTNPKVNIIAWMEFEPAYYDAAVQHISHYTTKTSPQRTEYKQTIWYNFGWYHLLKE